MAIPSFIFSVQPLSKGVVPLTYIYSLLMHIFKEEPNK